MKTMKYAKGSRTTSNSLESASYAVGVTYTGRTHHEVNILANMFNHTTTVLSGSERFKCRNLEMSKTVWHHELYALYPTFLLELIYFHPEVLAIAKQRFEDDLYVTKFQYSLLAAKRQAEAKNWDPCKEKEKRRSEVKLHPLCF
jgi:hypothetical protein